MDVKEIHEMLKKTLSPEDYIKLHMVIQDNPEIFESEVEEG